MPLPEMVNSRWRFQKGGYKCLKVLKMRFSRKTNYSRVFGVADDEPAVKIKIFFDLIQDDGLKVKPMELI